ncbi:hypothetical protein MLD38_003547 [Melastoma candidum]|uniref:Uncharacterized protein n=1 Tax=Melastoma candidum TaxID=119954 RepID=A0ACB9S7G7_9MYRT|nr:hypothetical protein MLD38_003547 [Melastoma candidum]
MKRMDLSCASHAFTAICTSLDHRSVVRHGTKPRAHRHELHCVRRYPGADHLPGMIKAEVPIPCTSYRLAITPRMKSHREDGNRASEHGWRESSPGFPRFF